MMPLESTDQHFVHIEVLDQTHFKYIVYVRQETEPFNFVPRIIYYSSFNGQAWVMDHVEYL